MHTDYLVIWYSDLKGRWEAYVRILDSALEQQSLTLH